MFPDHAPLIASPVICQKCGTVLKPKIIKNKRGVTHLEYSCTNAETGCSYRIETNVYLNGEMKGVRTDGSPVVIP